ncbi:MAG: rhodanese-like domain-containing protein [Marinibacterium sp.]|nr:rhodanese-like domain-containing protein [Marinibacterium sp.]
MTKPPVPSTQTPARFNRRHALLLGAASITAGVLISRPLLRRMDDGTQNLSVTDAHSAAQRGDITLIDIRRPDEWARTGIGQGAHPIDMRRDDFTDVLLALLGGDADRPVALICARGVRSARLTRRLSDAGFTHVINVPEGMLGSRSGPGWLVRDLPVYAYKE